MLFFAMGALYAEAQKNEAPVIMDAFPNTDQPKIALPFAAVKILDVRFDKSNIGCAGRSVSLSNRRYTKIPVVFPDSLHRHLPLLLNKFLVWDAASSDTLVLLVKQFRLSDYFVNGINRRYEPATLLKLSASFYRLRNNELFKLFSFDELRSKKWAADTRPDREFVEESRAASLLDMLHALFENRNWQPSGSGFALAGVEQGIRQRFALPLFNDTVLRAGVYKSFREFKANRPSVTAVNLVLRKQKLVAVNDSAGKELDLKDYWGACDGKKRYVFFRGDVSELEPSDKSFKFLSYVQDGELAGTPGFGESATQKGIIPALITKAMDNNTTREYFYLVGP